MQKTREADHFIYIELQNILQIMQNSDALTHFVITKWDLLQAAYSLGHIRDCLLQIDDFNHFVTSQSKRQIVRLIPVSAVGMKFAELQADGSMRKIPGAYPKPFHVELPFCCIWSDLLNPVAQSLQLSLEGDFSLKPVQDKRTALWSVAKSSLSRVLRLEEEFPESRFL
jgi:hypothetical protein